MAQEANPEIVSCYKPNKDRFARIVFVRHGQSVWNAANYFTGWVDVDLSELGVEEAKSGAQYLVKDGIKFDAMFTSYLKRAQRTGAIFLDAIGQKDIPITKSWRLNERMYGNLTGQHKKAAFETPLYDADGNGVTADKIDEYLKSKNQTKADLPRQYTKDEIAVWRRVFDVPPPVISETNKHKVKGDPKYKDLDDKDKPDTECLKDVIARVMPCWNDEIKPLLAKGQTLLIAAHGNSLRAILKDVDGIEDDLIRYLEVPTGFPLVYEFDKDLNVIPGPEYKALTAEQKADPKKTFETDKTPFPVKGQYMASKEAVEAARQKVKNQIKQ